MRPSGCQPSLDTTEVKSPPGTQHPKQVCLSHLHWAQNVTSPFTAEASGQAVTRAAFPRVQSGQEDGFHTSTRSLFMSCHHGTSSSGATVRGQSSHLLEVPGGRLPSSEVLQPLPAWSSSSEPATTKSDKGPGTSWAKYWESSDSEARESCGRQRRTAHTAYQEPITLYSDGSLAFQEHFVLMRSHSKQLR